MNRKSLRIVSRKVGNYEEIYNQAISVISGIQPVTISVPVDLAYEDGEWLVSGHTAVMRAINEAGSPE